METGLEQVRALAHPLRLRLMEVFARQPCTAKQAAELLGEPPTRLYHHVAALERAGLIRLRETRQNRGTTEKYFEASTNRHIASGNVLRDKDSRRALASMSLVVFDQARNELVRALARDDDPQNLVALRGVFHLSATAAKQLQKELMAMLAKLRQESKPSRAKKKRYTITIALVPTGE